MHLPRFNSLATRGPTYAASGTGEQGAKNNSHSGIKSPPCLLQFKSRKAIQAPLPLCTRQAKTVSYTNAYKTGLLPPSSSIQLDATGCISTLTRPMPQGHQKNLPPPHFSTYNFRSFLLTTPNHRGLKLSAYLSHATNLTTPYLPLSLVLHIAFVLSCSPAVFYSPLDRLKISFVACMHRLACLDHTEFRFTFSLPFDVLCKKSIWH